MDISDVVEQILRQRAVDGSKQDIAVENGLVSIALLDPGPLGIDPEGGGGGAAPELVCHKVNLEASDVVRGGVKKPIKVMFLYPVRVNKQDVGGTDSGQGLCNDRSDAAKPDNPYSKAS